MRRFIYIICVFLLGALISCRREEVFEGGEPLPPLVIDTDSINTSVLHSLANQHWVITQYRMETFSATIPLSDTIHFITESNMEYNHHPGTYSLYPSASVWMLNLNNTPWGMLSGAISDYSLLDGSIQGLPFSMITPGSAEQRINVWMDRID